MKGFRNRRTLRAALMVGTVFILVMMMVGWALASLPREDFDTGVPEDWSTFTRWPWGDYYPFHWKGDSGSVYVDDVLVSGSTQYALYGAAWLVTPVFHVDSGDVLTLNHQQTVWPDYDGGSFSKIWAILSDDYDPADFMEQSTPSYLIHGMTPDQIGATLVASFDVVAFSREEDFSLSDFEDEDIRLIFAFGQYDDTSWPHVSGDVYNTWSLDYAVVSQDQSEIVSPDEGDSTGLASNGGCSVSASLPLLALFIPLGLLLKK